MNVTVCASPSRFVGKKVWDAWNSWDSVLPIWPNKTSISALLISTSRIGRQTSGWYALCDAKTFSLPLVFKLHMSTSCLPISWRYLLNLSHNQKPTSSVSIITCDSLKSSTWHGVFRALIILSSEVWHFYKSAASKWWWFECFSVLDRLWNELFDLQLAASAPSFVSQIMVKKWALFKKSRLHRFV